MSHAEDLHTRHPAAGATDAVVNFVVEAARMTRSTRRSATTRAGTCSTPSA